MQPLIFRLRSFGLFLGTLTLIVQGRTFGQPRAEDGFLWIESVPQGAAVFIKLRHPPSSGFIHRGTTPCRVELPRGEYIARLEKEHYQIAEVPFEIGAKTVERRTVTLQQNPVLNIVTNVTNASKAFVSITGDANDRSASFRGKPIPLSGYEVPPGSYTLRAYAEFYQPKRERLELPAMAYTGPEQVEIYLNRYAAALTVITEPDGAEVKLVDLVEPSRPALEGKTPITFSSVGAGRHQLKISHSQSNGDKVVFDGEIRLEPNYQGTPYVPRLVYLDIYDYLKSTMGGASAEAGQYGEASEALQVASTSQREMAPAPRKDIAAQSDGLSDGPESLLLHGKVLRADGRYAIVDVGSSKGVEENSLFDLFRTNGEGPAQTHHSYLGEFKVEISRAHLVAIKQLDPKHFAPLEGGEAVVLVRVPRKKPVEPRTIVVPVSW